MWNCLHNKCIKDFEYFIWTFIFIRGYIKRSYRVNRCIIEKSFKHHYYSILSLRALCSSFLFHICRWAGGVNRPNKLSKNLKLYRFERISRARQKRYKIDLFITSWHNCSMLYLIVIGGVDKNMLCMKFIGKTRLKHLF